MYKDMMPPLSEVDEKVTEDSFYPVKVLLPVWLHVDLVIPGFPCVVRPVPYEPSAFRRVYETGEGDVVSVLFVVSA